MIYREIFVLGVLRSRSYVEDAHHFTDVAMGHSQVEGSEVLVEWRVVEVL